MAAEQEAPQRGKASHARQRLAIAGCQHAKNSAMPCQRHHKACLALPRALHTQTTFRHTHQTISIHKLHGLFHSVISLNMFWVTAAISPIHNKHPWLHTYLLSQDITIHNCINIQLSTFSYLT